MAGKTSVVTPERFATGLSYEKYIAQINVNKDRFQQSYEGFQVSSDDADFFKKAVADAKGPTKMMVIGEDWCPDVYRGMPMMARLAEAAGMEMRVFPRDENSDIMDEFLKDGEYKSIPVAVFYTSDHEYIGHWIERPVMAHSDRAKIDEDIKKEMPEASEEDVRAKTRERTLAHFTAWQQESVREMRDMIAKHLGTA
jgi:thiol-disulfide isomerase/thioredoxin